MEFGSGGQQHPQVYLKPAETVIYQTILVVIVYVIPNRRS